MPRHVGPKTRLFVASYCDPGPAQFKAIAAAALAGYRFPHLSGPRLLSKHKELIDQRLAERIAGPQEVLMICSEIARDRQAAESSRLKASELMIRVHGLIGSDITVNFNRQALEAEIVAEARRLLPADDPRRARRRALPAPAGAAIPTEDILDSDAVAEADVVAASQAITDDAPAGGANRPSEGAEPAAAISAGRPESTVAD